METSKTRKWLGLLSLMPAIAMIFVDQSILPVALPTIQKHLNASYTQLWWCINSYLLVSAVLLLAGGKLGDKVGHKKIFSIGMVTFAIASALCGLSPTINWLIAARSLQGVGAALMIPASSPLIMSLFPEKERGKAVGLNVSISSLFAISGPLIGGYCTEALSWRWIFWINLPLAVAGLILQLTFLPKSPKGKQTFDPWGFLYFTVGSTSLIVLIMQGSEWGWTSLTSIGSLCLSILATLLLLRREKNAKHPFFDRSLFRHPIYTAVNLSVFATQFVLMIVIYRAVFFQNVLGWSPIKSGALSMITSIPVLFMSYIGGWLSDRFTPKIPITLGFSLLIFSFFWLAFFIESPLWVILIGLFALGFGVPLIFTPSYSSAMNAIPPKKAGSAFGILATTRALSGCLGVAIISAVASFVQFGTFRDLINKSPITKSLDPIFLEGLSKGIPNIQESLTKEELPVVLNYMKESELQGFFSVHFLIAFALIIASVFVFTLYHRKSNHELPKSPADGWD